MPGPPTTSCWSEKIRTSTGSLEKCWHHDARPSMPVSLIREVGTAAARLHRKESRLFVLAINRGVWGHHVGGQSMFAAWTTRHRFRARKPAIPCGLTWSSGCQRSRLSRPPPTSQEPEVIRVIVVEGSPCLLHEVCSHSPSRSPPPAAAPPPAEQRLNMFCQYIYLWMYVVPAADL